MMFGDWRGERPLYEVKANLFKGLAHPLRIRLLELLSEAAGRPAPDHEVAVTKMLAETGLEPSSLSQHLAVLRRNNLAVAERRGSQVFYRLTYPEVADLLVVSRHLLTTILVDNAARIALPQNGSARGRQSRANGSQGPVSSTADLERQ